MLDCGTGTHKLICQKDFIRTVKNKQGKKEGEQYVLFDILKGLGGSYLVVQFSATHD
jgi:hypothetical protein